MSGCVPVCITDGEFSASETLCTHAHLIVCHAWNWKHCNPQMTLKNGCAAPQRMSVLNNVKLPQSVKQTFVLALTKAPDTVEELLGYHQEVYQQLSILEYWRDPYTNVSLVSMPCSA